MGILDSNPDHNAHLYAHRQFYKTIEKKGRHERWLSGAINSDSRFSRSDWGAGGWGGFKNMSASEHFYRARKFAFGGSGANTEDAMNAVGMLTKKQIELGKASKMTRAFNLMTPIGTLGGIGMSDGGADYLFNWALPEIGGLGGWRVGKSLAAGIAKSGGASNLALGRATLAGGIGFAAAGYLVTAGIGSAIHSSTSSENFIRRKAESLGSFRIENEIDQNDMTLTHRQKALQKLSKSALNNRGQLLGNEANIIAGLL